MDNVRFNDTKNFNLYGTYVFMRYRDYNWDWLSYEWRQQVWKGEGSFRLPTLLEIRDGIKQEDQLI